LLATKALRPLLFGVEPGHPPTFSGAIAGMAVVSLLTNLVPALRAASVDSMMPLLEGWAAGQKACKIKLKAVMPGVSVNVQPAATPDARSTRRTWVSTAILLVGAVLLVWMGTLWRARIASAQVRSLAVLPFADLTQKKEGWIAAGFTGETIDALSHAPGLQVVGRTSAFRLKDDAVKQLGVAAVLEGSVSQSGDRLHISVVMTRTSDGYHLWSATFSRRTSELRQAIQDVSTAAAGRLQVRPPAATSRYQPPPKAYEAYLQGRYLFDQANPEALKYAQERLEEATDTGPNFVPAWAWLSIVREYRVAGGMARPNQLMPGSRDAAERAVALDPESGIAHLALGIVKLQYDWDWACAKEELDRAVQAMPESAFALAWRARWFQSQGRMKEAISETGRALVLDPLSAAIASDAAAQYVVLNQADRAIPFARKAVDLNPGDPAAQAALANVLWLAGQRDKSRQIVEQLRSSGAAAKLPASVLALLEARMGEPTNARQLLDAAEDLPDDQLLPAVEYAGLASVLQDWDRMFSWTEEAYGERDVELPYWGGSPLVPKSDPRFDAFLAEMNLPAPETH
jgi:TolB-like protein